METYEIRVRGHLAAGWADWLGGLTIAHLPGGETVVCGPLPDQAALRSVLNRIWDLNLEVVALSVTTSSPSGACSACGLRLSSRE